MEEMADVVRIEAEAELCEAPEAVAGAERLALEDPDFDRLLADWRAGRVLLASLNVGLEATALDGSHVRSGLPVATVWLERDQPPKVEAQVAAEAASCLPDACTELRRHGVLVRADDLLEMFVHVELGPRLRAELDRPSWRATAGGSGIS